MLSHGEIIGIMQEAIYTVIIAAAPMLIVAIAVGLIISIFQATTQIHEQTLAFVPKIVAIMFSLLIFGNFVFNTIEGFVVRLYGSINSMIG